MFTSNKSFIKLNLPFVVNTAFYKIMIVDLEVEGFLYVLYIHPLVQSSGCFPEGLSPPSV